MTQSITPEVQEVQAGETPISEVFMQDFETLHQVVDTYIQENLKRFNASLLEAAALGNTNKLAQISDIEIPQVVEKAYSALIDFGRDKKTADLLVMAMEAKRRNRSGELAGYLRQLAELSEANK